MNDILEIDGNPAFLSQAAASIGYCSSIFKGRIKQIPEYFSSNTFYYRPSVRRIVTLINILGGTTPGVIVTDIRTN
jgi:hypothetical protein